MMCNSKNSPTLHLFGIRGWGLQAASATFRQRAGSLLCTSKMHFLPWVIYKFVLRVKHKKCAKCFCKWRNTMKMQCKGTTAAF